MKEFANLVLGHTSPAMFAALFFFAVVGVFINLLLHAQSRNVLSTDTPEKFSFRFLLYDNWRRIVLAILLIYISIRFVGIIFDIDVVNNNELYLFAALIIGFLFDKLGEYLKSRSSILRVRK